MNKTGNELNITQEFIKNKIHIIRNSQVILDKDLAKLYDVSIKRLNEQVKRNKERFPDNFMFQLTQLELKSLRSQFATLDNGRGRFRKYLPYVFTEQGISMLSAVLKSKTAIKISIKIIETFVAMRHFISSNAQIFQRLDRVELKQIEQNNKFSKIFDALEVENPKKGIFFDGQIFDAHIFISNIIRKAQKEIILIDNYIDENTLNLFSKRKQSVKVIIYTKKLNQELKLDISKFNQQYQNIEMLNNEIVGTAKTEFLSVKEFNKSHDRFLIIDNKELYHLGASLKCSERNFLAYSKISDFRQTQVRNGLHFLDLMIKLSKY